jgi:hypothetical protein
MSIQTGDAKYQDVMPIDLAPRADLGSSCIRTVERGPSDYKESKNYKQAATAQPKSSFKKKKRRFEQDEEEEPLSGMDEEDEFGAFSAEEFDNVASKKTCRTMPSMMRKKQKHHHQKHPGIDRKKRLYRPGSPTDSIGSADFEILADKTKFKAQADEKATKLPRDDTFDRVRNSHARGDMDEGRHSRHSSHDIDYAEEDDDGGANTEYGGGGGYGVNNAEYESDGMGIDGEDDGYGDEDEEGYYSDDNAVVDGVLNPRTMGPSGGNDAPRMTYEERIKKKAFLLAKFERRRQHGILKMEINDNMTLEDLMIADSKLTYHSRGETMVGTMRRLTMFYIFILEAMAANFPKLHMDCTGFSESMMQKQTENDELLYEIWDLYHDSMTINPVWQHVVSITSQALMYSIGRKVMAGVLESAMGGGGQKRGGMMGMGGGGSSSGHQAMPAPIVNHQAAPAQQQQQQQPFISDTDISMAPQELLQMLREEEQKKVEQSTKQQQQDQPQQAQSAQQQQQPGDSSTAAFKTIDLGRRPTTTGRRTIELVKESSAPKTTTKAKSRVSLAETKETGHHQSFPPLLPPANTRLALASDELL